jgi:hypothetical protein
MLLVKKLLSDLKLVLKLPNQLEWAKNLLISKKPSPLKLMPNLSSRPKRDNKEKILKKKEKQPSIRKSLKKSKQERKSMMNLSKLDKLLPLPPKPRMKLDIDNFVKRERMLLLVLTLRPLRKAPIEELLDLRLPPLPPQLDIPMRTILLICQLITSLVTSELKRTSKVRMPKMKDLMEIMMRMMASLEWMKRT